MTGINQGISKRLSNELLATGLSNKELAYQIGCTDISVGNWINRKSIPQAQFFPLLYDAGFDIMYILTGERTQ